MCSHMYIFSYLPYTIHTILQSASSLQFVASSNLNWILSNGFDVNAAGKLIRSIAFAVSRTWLNIILPIRVRSWNWNCTLRLGVGVGVGLGLELGLGVGLGLRVGLVFQFNRFKVTRNAVQFIDRPRAGPHWERCYEFVSVSRTRSLPLPAACPVFPAL